MCLNKTQGWCCVRMHILWYSLVFSDILCVFCFFKLNGKWQFEKLNYILYINKKMIIYI